MSKEFKNIDDLFRDRFENFEVDPPDYVWENVQTEISGKPGKGSGFGSKGGGIAGITTILVVIGFVSLLFINNSSGTNKESLNKQVVDANLLSTNLIADNQSHTGSDQQIIEPEFSDFSISEKKISQVQSESKHVDVSGNTPKSKKELRKERKEKEKQATLPKRNSSLIIDPVDTKIVEPERMAHQGLTVATIETGKISHSQDGISSKIESAEISDHQIAIESGLKGMESSQSIGTEMVRGQAYTPEEDTKHNSLKSDYGQSSPWSLGVYFTPEMIVYPSDNQLKNYSFSFDFLGTYKPGNYFLQSGLGLARNQEQGETMINYNQYIGSYEDVYDVTFDSTSSGVVPIYHTETVNVYDSIDHVVITPSKRYFTYLQIPLLVGYGKESKRFGWFVKGGPSVSFLLHENTPNSGVDQMEDRILNVENQLPGRIKTNWQFILTAGATYKLGPKVSISVEPMFRYYVQSVYESDQLNTKHPYSIGLRTGFLLDF